VTAVTAVASERPDELDGLLGDPWDAGNRLGYSAVVAADERREMFAEAEKQLDAFALNAEFVPAALGGRLTRVDHLAALLRTLWRRDPCLGLGYGFSSFIASVNIWSAGDQAQQRRAADLLLANRRIASVYHELEHGNDFSAAEFAARPAASGGWLLNGRKEVVTNFERADALVLFARTDPARGSRSHSQFLVLKEGLPAGALRYVARFPSSGMRGVQLGGGVFTDCWTPADTLLGKPGQGIETALKSFQLTRAMIPSMCVGPLDTALRAAVGFALERRLYGDAVVQLPQVRAALARAYADLLAVDAFTTAVVRSLHALPEQTAVYASASKYLNSRILVDAFDDLRTVLGARAYLRDGPYAIFQKAARDTAIATFGHASRSACLVTVLPQLPRLARRSWLADPAAPPCVFQLASSLPALDFARLAAGSPRSDSLAATLVEAAEGAARHGLVGRLAARFRDELIALRAQCTALAPRDLTLDARRHAFAAADRYTVVLAAAAALGVWSQCPDTLDETALVGVLDRLLGRLPGPAVLTQAQRAEAEARLLDELFSRHRGRRLFDLTARPIPG
jgi:alkylation response protein AidB-like acyl-CoA dehydrogenase